MAFWGSMADSSKAPVAVLSVLFLAFMLVSCSENDGPAGPAITKTDSTWTYIVYDAADGSAVDIYDNYVAGPNLHSGPYVNLIGLHDSETEEATIWRIDENNDLEILEELGEINMGAEETLYDLVMYAKEQYPADRYIMTFYGHGGKWFGCCGDQTNQDALRLHEIRGALEGAGGVDMVLFTAPCLMGCVETFYELRNCTEITIASEDYSCFAYWTYPLEEAFAAMHATPTISPSELSELIIGEIWRNRDWYPQYGLDSNLTMCAVRSSKMEALRIAIDDVARGYIADPGLFVFKISLLRNSVTAFDDAAVDLKSLAEQMLLIETDTSLRELLEKIPVCIERAVIAECHGDNYPDVAGISIFLPRRDFQWLSYYTGDEDMTLQFAERTGWDELVSTLVTQTSGIRSNAPAVPLCVVSP